ncbi:MAG: protein phosphatase 2C domain-containing protein [Candidatus Eremiobacteraeota bacterium]|nr:protein phosphatase 2C domain-containing protein [Candidatus Eremiobacteraeota bacterium]
MEIAARTEPGLRQREHSDAHLVESIAPNIVLLAVADGFGRVSRGLPTAQCALATLRDYLRRRHRLGSYGRNPSPSSLRTLMLAALDHANSRLFGEGGTHEDFVGSGTSLTAALVVGEHALVGHVGDARAYLLRLGNVELLTVDDAMFADATVAGAKRNLAAQPRPRGLLWRTLGTQAKLEASIAHVELFPDDQMLLCTDGVHRALDDDELGEALLHGGTASDVVGRVLALARGRDTYDDLTLVVGRDPFGPTAAGAARAPRGGLRVFVALALLIVALLSFGSYALQHPFIDRTSNVTNSSHR